MTTSADVVPGATPRPGAASLQETRTGVLREVELAIEALLAAERDRWETGAPRALVLIDGIGDLVAAGGKRLRPAFCVSGYLAAGGDADEPALARLAAGLELLHVSALLHDDVLDSSDRRRGRPTLHVAQADAHRAAGWRGGPERFGENAAILAGDLALVYADQLVGGAPPPVLDEWARMRSEMMVGQFLDVSLAAEYDADPEASRRIAVCKSGHYSIHRPLSIGALLAGRSDLSASFEEYGRALGEAFQLRDDLIDAFGDGEVTGKPAGLDFEQHKMTLLLALAVQRDERVRALVLPRGGGVGRAEAVELRALLTESGVRAEVEDRVDRLVTRAVSALRDAPLSDAWRDELASMAHQVAYRDR
ncbi:MULTISPECIES: polyprenyl synthetase family protein [unclassified Streptomyces]|uniref:polyprenyl synthetase family protein n=1 Tax=unclassified Streptomyces TaxID=2593676 RepID=UPI0022B6D01E|nr:MULTISPECIES: polyprenyl synthetase family protein [unclassified Streptomyces]MCZ7416002.1 polyprenyl synthetase family protein [Streptomyces sp. WMMC897]MCZ7434191.1 polyprenyl synthetase family protein [Streptomyces sp. WMMC1477]